MSDYRDSIDQQVTDAVALTPIHKGDRHMARAILDALVGNDDAPGPLDRYEIRAIKGQAPDAKPLVIWYCPGAHTDDEGEPAGTGHVGIIARDLDGDQTGLTLGEILEAVLRHDREDHS